MFPFQYGIGVCFGHIRLEICNNFDDRLEYEASENRDNTQKFVKDFDDHTRELKLESGEVISW